MDGNGFALASLPQPTGGKFNLQLKDGARKAGRGEKEVAPPLQQSGGYIPSGPASPGPQGTPIPGYEQRNQTSELESDSGGAHRRDKRCTCYTYKDKECVYYCHLDIIWINTPERTVPYGLSSYRGRFRGKRSIEKTHSSSEGKARCSCIDLTDQQCVSFCARRKSKRSSQKKTQSASKLKQMQIHAVA
ncbi:endothelin-3 isoform X2 [Bombina bombina]|uniref:endothelin-3 isoform X2 n=1 Tax=Bombina bombina TaxID=8345 RepID=UPI00235B1299|nr:endothelin-3 isoform X2 [Bombina bombina]